MSYNRKVSSRIHSDEKYRSLDDSGKVIFLTILTHQFLMPMGAMRLTKLGLINDMEPEVGSKKFKEKSKSFDKLIELGMVEYDKAGMVVLPNYLKHNPPCSGKNVKGWEPIFDSFPECELKNRLIARCMVISADYKSDPLRGYDTDAPPNALPYAPPHALPYVPNGVRAKEQKSIRAKSVRAERDRDAKAFPSQDKVYTIHSEEVQKVVRKVIAKWPAYNKATRPYKTDAKTLAENIAKILNEHPRYGPGFLIYVAEYYIHSKPNQYLAPQKFFGEMDDGSRPWEERVVEISATHEIESIEDEDFETMPTREEKLDDEDDDEDNYNF